MFALLCVACDKHTGTSTIPAVNAAAVTAAAPGSSGASGTCTSLTSLISVQGSATAGLRSSPSGGGGLPGGTALAAWLTTADQTQFVASVALQAGVASGGTTITVNAATHYQPIDGFGAAMTESSATLLAALPASQLTTVMASLFKPGGGAGITLLRVPMGSSDFAVNTDYSYDDGQPDPTMASFSVSADDAVVVPMVKQALAINPNIKILATPVDARRDG